MEIVKINSSQSSASSASGRTFRSSSSSLGKSSKSSASTVPLSFNTTTNSIRTDESDKTLKVIKILPSPGKKYSEKESYSLKKVKIKRSDVEEEPKPGPSRQPNDSKETTVSLGSKRGFFYRKELELAAKRTLQDSSKQSISIGFILD